jgi:hypothetical protein
LKKELGWSDADDGMFFIPFDDYLNFYTSTTICKVHDNYHYNSVSTKQEKDSHTFFTFELDDDSYIDLTVSQVAKRMVNKKYGYKCSQVKMILARINKGESPMFEYIDGTKGDENDVTMDLEEHLPAGKYVCFVEIDWRYPEQMNKFSFSIYSEIEIHIKTEGEHAYDNMLQQALMSCAIKKGKFKDYSDNGEPDIRRCIILTDSKAEYGYVYYENNSLASTLSETVKFTEMKNLKLLPPYSGKEVIIKIGPGEKKIAILKRTDRKANYQFSSFSSVSLPPE